MNFSFSSALTKPTLEKVINVYIMKKGRSVKNYIFKKTIKKFKKRKVNIFFFLQFTDLKVFFF